MDDTEVMIRLKGVSKAFPGATAPAVDSLSLDIPRGEIVTLVGPSGCGKTTTLKMINRIIEPTAGQIWIDGTEATETAPHLLRRSIGYVIQQVGLFPHRTIAQNIATVPQLLDWERDRVKARISELIEIVGLDAELLDRFPSELSGGQQQRVGVARALAADPPILLMDEPFGAVDPIVRERLQEELLSVQERLKKTIVFVTHDIDEAIKLGNRVAILKTGGLLAQYGPPGEILADPADEFVASFLGRDRGLKRLSLIPVSAIDLEPGPVVSRAATRDEVVMAMNQAGLDWVTVVDNGTLLGWLWGDEVGPSTRIADLDPRPFRITIQLSATLREALDAIVNTRNQTAVVCDGERYVGMLTVGQISKELVD